MDGEPPYYLTLMRRLLLFNALADNFDRGAAADTGTQWGGHGAHAGEDAAKAIQNGFCEYLTAVFCHEDQVNLHQKNAVSALSNIVVISHRQNYNLFMQRLNLPMRIHAQRRLLRLTARGRARRNFTNQQ